VGRRVFTPPTLAFGHRLAKFLWLSLFSLLQADGSQGGQIPRAFVTLKSFSRFRVQSFLNLFNCLLGQSPVLDQIPLAIFFSRCTSSGYNGADPG
jgi:hypothetical protein